jgi:hypothetical protein
VCLVSRRLRLSGELINERNKECESSERGLPHSPNAHRSEDWSCPKLKTSSGDRYSEERVGDREGGGRRGKEVGGERRRG